MVEDPNTRPDSAQADADTQRNVSIGERGGSSEKLQLGRTSFEELPDEIIQQILSVASPDVFASLVLLNQKWRHASQHTYLYLSQLRRCSSDALPNFRADSSSSSSSRPDALPNLRRLFALQVKRRLFPAYLRPKETIIKLVSNSISSSSAPGGEGMQFSASPLGHHVLAYNTSRIYVIDVRSSKLEVKRELKLLRRPVSACIKDDGTFLVVLSTEMQVDLYDMTTRPPTRKHSIILDNTPRAIAISPCGSVLATAYEGGIEVTSLSTNSPSSSQRRAVKCDPVDALAFSSDGTQILGTTTGSGLSNTVILTAPYYDPGNPTPSDDIGSIWTASILFPNTSKDCSHAVLLQDGSDEEAAWTFTYDRSFEMFRAVRIDDLRNGTTYFTGPTTQLHANTHTATQQYMKLLPSTLPTATYKADVVAAGFEGKDVWVYGIPSDLEAPPEQTVLLSEAPGNSTTVPGRRPSANGGTSRRSTNRAPENTSLAISPWQLLSDQERNKFIRGHKVAELSRVSTMKWVSNFTSSSLKERLVLGARGVSNPAAVKEDDIDFVDGGRITFLDFDYRPSNGERTEIVIEVGTEEAEVLEEEKRDLEEDVAILRRRTVARTRGSRNNLLRTATSGAAAASTSALVPPIPQDYSRTENDPLLPRRVGQTNFSRGDRVVSNPTVDDEEFASIDEMEAMDQPYAHTSPRSGGTLRRAATAVAANRTLHPRTADGRPIEYRRADGRREHPHESDADNWVPPPPPYQKDDPGSVPAFLRGPAVTAPDNEVRPTIPIPPYGSIGSHPPQRTNWPFVSEWVSSQRLSRASGSLRHRPSHHRTASDSTTRSRPVFGDLVRPMSSPSLALEYDELYDASPPTSPPRRAASISEPQSPDPERGVSPLSPDSPPADEAILTVIASQTSVALPETPPTTGGSPPTLSVAVPSTARHDAESAVETAPRGRSLSTSQTWPAGPQAPVPELDATLLNGFPRSAPVREDGGNSNGLVPNLPPLPSSSQLASLNRRMGQGNPHRLSGSLASSRDRPVPRNSILKPPLSDRPVSMGMPAVGPTDADRPLIISTPDGITGGGDMSVPRDAESGRQTPLHAPVPRHTIPSRYNSSPRPMVERLETIWSITSAQGAANGQYQQPPAPQVIQANRFLPAWMNTSPARSANGISRRPSRAERSAAKNILDAKKRGWRPRREKKQKKEPSAVSNDNNNNRISVNYNSNQHAPNNAIPNTNQSFYYNGEASNNSEWRDISSSTQPKAPKERKCSVM